MPDRDEFPRTTRSGKAAAAALGDAAEGKELDRETVARVISQAFQACDGVPVLPRLLDAWPEDSPNLEIRFDPLDDVLPRLDAIDRILRDRDGTVLDQLAARAFHRAVLRGESRMQALERFLTDVVLRNSVHAKGGLIERWGAERMHQLMPLIEALIAPVARSAAEMLLERPEAKRLSRLTRMYRTEVDVFGNL